jgi:hypothetical protein
MASSWVGITYQVGYEILDFLQLLTAVWSVYFHIKVV